LVDRWLHGLKVVPIFALPAQSVVKLQRKLMSVISAAFQLQAGPPRALLSPT